MRSGFLYHVMRWNLDFSPAPGENSRARDGNLCSLRCLSILPITYAHERSQPVGAEGSPVASALP